MCSQGLVRLCKPFKIYATVGKRNATATPTQMHASNKKRRRMTLDDSTSRSFDIEIFWVMTPCSLVGGYWYFGERCCLHIQDALLRGGVDTSLAPLERKQGTVRSLTGPDPENTVGDQDTGSPGRTVSAGLQVSGEPGHCRARTRPPWWLSCGVFFSPPQNVLQLHQQRWVILRCDSLALWKIINKENVVLIPKIRDEKFPADFCTRKYLTRGGVSRYAATQLIVALSPGHSYITIFRPCSPIATANRLDRTEKFPKVAQMTDTVDVFDPRSDFSGPTSRRASTCPNLHEWWT